MESILELLPNNEKQNVKAFLLMQQERIEKLEELIQKLVYAQSSKYWIISGISSISMIMEIKKVIKKKSGIRNFIYNTKNYYIFINFDGYINKVYIEELLEDSKIDMTNIKIETSDYSITVYNGQFISEWQHVSSIHI
jgi:hypothetical protein